MYGVCAGLKGPTVINSYLPYLKEQLREIGGTRHLQVEELSENYSSK